MATGTIRLARLSALPSYYIGLALVLTMTAAIADPRVVADWITDAFVPVAESGSASLPAQPALEVSVDPPISAPEPAIIEIASAAAAGSDSSLSTEKSLGDFGRRLDDPGVTRSIQVASRTSLRDLVTETSATIGWRSNTATDGVVSYGTVRGSLTSSAAPASVTDHFVTVSALSPGTKYFYNVSDSVLGHAGAPRLTVSSRPRPGARPRSRFGGRRRWQQHQRKSA
jgi:hypothetical protein